MENNIRIAVIKTDGLGDAVLASPFLFELRRLYRGARITGFLSPGGAEILGGLGVFDEIIIHDAKWLKYKKAFFLSRWLSALSLLLKVNKGGFDIAVGLRWQDRLTSLILSLCSAKDKYGYDTGGMGFGINHKVPMPAHNTHVINRNMEVLRHMLPGKKFSIKLGITVENEPALSGGKPPLNKIKGKYIVLHPVSGCPAKDWAIENYAELASRFAKKMPVYIIGAGGDKGIDSISGKNIHNTAGSLSIRGIASLIKGASLVIGNDSAAVHMAAALGTKSLTIFSGSALYGEWGAYGKNAFILTKDVPCRECGLFACDKPLHECMDISEGEVEKAAVRVLSGRQKSRVIRT